MYRTEAGLMANPRIPYVMAHQRPRLTAPNGRPIIVHFVVNIEYWPFDKAMPRKILTPPHGVEQLPDVPNFCWAEYGLRAGMSRILRLFRAHGIAASASLNASVADAYPACVEAVLEAGWELIGHGIHQASLQSVEHERDVVGGSLARLEAVSGRKVRGWLSPGLRESAETPDILAEMGLDYVCDWGVDDLPSLMATRAGELIAMPYTLELNDSVIYAVERHRSEEMFSRVSLTLECLAREAGRHAPRVLGIGLHPHLIGVPHRFVYLERIVDLLAGNPDVCFMSGSAIADWFSTQVRS